MAKQQFSVHHTFREQTVTAAPMRLAQIVTLMVCVAGCDIPQDPEGTLERVRGGVLLVGVTESPPWVRRTPAGAEGVEAELVREFADHIGAQIHWRWADSESNLAALERYQLDLVIGNLSKASPWSKKVAISIPYYTETLMVGFADKGAHPIEGATVCVQEGSELAALLKEQDAVPRTVPNPWECEPPIAAGLWELEAHGLHPVLPPLQNRKHVMAAPPGENAFLVELSRFLDGRHAAVHRRLCQAAERREEASQP